MKNTSEKENEKKQGIGTGVIAGISVVYLILGLAMLFVPAIREVYIVYMLCAVLIAFGILTIVRYFTGGHFLDTGQYSFSGGVLAVIAGFCILVRSAQVAESFGLFLGICVLLTAVVKLQNAVDLNAMKNRSWPVFLILALVFLVLSVLVILDLFSWREKQMDVIYVILAADGAVGLFSMIYMMIASRMYRKNPKQKAQNPSEEAEIAEITDISNETSEKDIPDTEAIKEADVPQSAEPTAGDEVQSSGSQGEIAGKDTSDFPSDEEILKAVFRDDTHTSENE